MSQKNPPPLPPPLTSEIAAKWVYGLIYGHGSIHQSLETITKQKKEVMGWKLGEGRKFKLKSLLNPTNPIQKLKVSKRVLPWASNHYTLLNIIIHGFDHYTLLNFECAWP